MHVLNRSSEEGYKYAQRTSVGIEIHAMSRTLPGLQAVTFQHTHCDRRSVSARAFREESSPPDTRRLASVLSLLGGLLT